MADNEVMKAYVTIGAALEPLKRGLSMVKGMVSTTLSGATGLIKGAFSALSSMLQTIYKHAKRAMIAVTALLTASVWKAGKQEQAEYKLAAALKITGEYTDKTMEKFKAFASSIQDVTKYGDEDTLALMRLMSSLGVSADKLEDATKSAIGMAAATDRDVKSMAMYIALAQQGEFTMLRRYIPALRATTDATEQMRIVNEFTARGFKLAQEEANTFLTKVIQTKNRIGDAFEKIGKPFLEPLSKGLDKLNKLLKDNENKIGEWSEIIVMYVSEAVSLIVKLWKSKKLGAAIKYATDLGLAQFEQWGQQIIVLFKWIGEAIGNALVSGLKGAGAKKIDHEIIRLKKKWQLMFDFSRGFQSSESIKKEANDYADQETRKMEDQGYYDYESTADSLSEVLKQIQEIEKRAVEIPLPIQSDFVKFADHVEMLRGNIRYDWAKKDGGGNGGDKGEGNKGAGDNKEIAATQSKFAFTGIRDAWKTFTQGISNSSPELAEAKNQTAALKELNSEAKLWTKSQAQVQKILENNLISVTY